MSMIIGLDVGSDSGEWSQARVDSQQARLHIVDQPDPLWTSAGSVLRLEQSVMASTVHATDGITKPAKEVDLISRDLQPHVELLKKRLLATDPPRAIGLAVPYGLAAPIARALEKMVSWTPTPNRPPMRPLVVEAPLAACVQWFAQESPSLNADKSIRVLVLTIGVHGTESTTVVIQVAKDELRLSVAAWSAFAETASSANLPLAAPDVVLVVGNPSPTAVERAERLGCPQVRLPASTNSRGAARIAAAEAFRVLHDTECTKVRADRLLPHTLGMLACNREGQGVWRSVLPKGTRSSTLPASVELLGRTPTKLPIIVLAEPTAEGMPEREWLLESQWEKHGLRLHSSWSLSNAPRGDKNSHGKIAMTVRGPVWPRVWTSESLQANWRETPETVQ